jgi:hypothetical protein
LQQCPNAAISYPVSDFPRNCQATQPQREKKNYEYQENCNNATRKHAFKVSRNIMKVPGIFQEVAQLFGFFHWNFPSDLSHFSKINEIVADPVLHNIYLLTSFCTEKAIWIKQRKVILKHYPVFKRDYLAIYIVITNKLNALSSSLLWTD